MQLSFSNNSLPQFATEALIVPLLSDVAPSRLRGFDAELAKLIARLNHHGDWKGEPNEVAIFYPHHAGEVFSNLKRIVLVGMGKQADWEYEQMRAAVATGVQAVAKRKLGSAALLLPDGTTPATARDLAAIVLMAAYQFSQYKTHDKDKVTQLTEVVLVAPGITKTDEFAAAVTAGTAIGQATCFVRDLTNHPSNAMTPRHLAADARELAGEGVTVEVFGRKELEKMKMGALLAVAKGSVEEPQLIVVEYEPRPKNPKSEIPASPAGGRNPKSEPFPTVALVGKGITFDSGGISIKPSDGMEEMKMDMAGAATCLGVIAAAKALQLPVRLVAVLPATENLPSGSAIKPGDIVTAYDGQTIEILNTDAEGRVVLADGLAYAAKEFAPDAIIDLATLTGAAIVALGHEATPMLGNDAKLLETVRAAAGRTGERVWELPLWQEYKDAVKSDLADVKNLGEGRKAGTIAGAAFLSYFVPKDTPWVHLDIAGTAMMDKPRRPYVPKGGTGWGVRLLVDVLEHWK